jgi:hypothetical protein
MYAAKRSLELLNLALVTSTQTPVPKAMTASAGSLGQSSKQDRDLETAHA